MRDYFDWTKEASCSDMDPDIYGRPYPDRETREAMRICQRTCPVREDCLMHAIIYGENGRWGGYEENIVEEMGRGGVREKLIDIAYNRGVYHAEFMVKPLRVELPEEEVA